MKRTFEIELNIKEELLIVRRWCCEKPKIVKTLLNTPNGNCPFPEHCNRFPCDTLNCYADECDNGHARRRS